MKNAMHYRLVSPASAATMAALFITMLMLSACEQKLDKNTLKAEIVEANQSWMEAVKKKDADALAALYAEDALVLPPNVPAIKGRAGAKSFFGNAMGAGIREIRLVTEEVDGDEENAIEKGAYEMKVDGDMTVDRGKYLVHWRKVNGEWRLYQDMFNSDMPAPAAPSLKKGNIVGVHVITLKLKPGVTVNGFIDHYNKTVIPEMAKIWPEAHTYVIKGLRGEQANRVGLIYVFESEAVRNKYFKADGTPTEAALPILDRLDQLEKTHGEYERKYTDWVVQ